MRGQSQPPALVRVSVPNSEDLYRRPAQACKQAVGGGANDATWAWT